jgi:protein-S-isoprenylcysteine O-methyltransferase Ste14
MNSIPMIVSSSWAALALVWLIGLARTKKTIRTQPTGARILHSAFAILGFYLLGSKSLSRGWLGADLYPAGDWIHIAGVVVTVAGCLFAIWARITLGSNWSARATVKAGHELVVTGPYGIARHPIYTGLLLAATGTALAYGQVHCLLGLVLIFVALAVKIGQEERLMLETFPEAYPVYRRRVKALIPGVF